MSTQRIVDYWHTPVPQPFVDYVLQRATAFYATPLAGILSLLTSVAGLPEVQE